MMSLMSASEGFTMYQPFNCAPDAPKIETKQFIQSEIQAIFNLDHMVRIKQILLKGRKYEDNIVYELDSLFKAVRKIWVVCEDGVLTENAHRKHDIDKCSKDIIKLLETCRTSFKSCTNHVYRKKLSDKIISNLQIFMESIRPIHEYDENALMKVASPSVKGNQSKEAHYFHLYLDVSWLILTIYVTWLQPAEYITDIVKFILKDFAVYTYFFFQKLKESSGRVTKYYPFICPCVMRFYEMLWRFIQRYHSFKLFQSIFNEVFDSYNEEFCLWIFCNTILSQKGNVEFFEKKFKGLVAKCTEGLRDYDISTAAWSLSSLLLSRTGDVSYSLKIEPFQLLCDYFFKNINRNFEEMHMSGLKLLKHIGEVMGGKNLNTFDLYLKILVLKLRRRPDHWSKLKGRIYSRLTRNKLMELNDNGLYNICHLLLGLAALVKFKDINTQLIDLLELIAPEKKQLQLFWVILTGLILNYLNQAKMIDEGLCKKVNKIMEELSENRDNYHLIKYYIEGVEEVIAVGKNGTMGLNQHLLIGNWIQNYMLACSYNDLCITLRLLGSAVTKVDSSNESWRNLYFKLILPILKQLAISPSQQPPQIGKLALMICKKFPQAIDETVNYFSGENVNPKIQTQFLAAYLNIANPRLLSFKQQDLITEAWIRLGLIDKDGSIRAITKKIMNFSRLKCFKIEQPAIPFSELSKCIAKQVKLEPNQISTLKELVEICYSKIDKLLQAIMTSPNYLETDPDTIYMRVSILVREIPELIYNKSKSNCLLSKIVNILLLPSDILIGKPPKPEIYEAISQTWCVFFNGIYKLHNVVDIYIDRVLREMVVRYLPLFDEEAAFLTCDDNKQNLYVLDKLIAGFVGQNVKTSEENTQKALVLIKLYLEDHEFEEDETYKHFMEKSLPNLFEVVLFHNNKTPALDIIKFLAICKKYVEIRDDLKKALLKVMEKHLAFNSNNFFQMAITLVKFIPMDMKDILPDVKKQITIVERMRGVGYDNILRQYLSRFESELSHADEEEAKRLVEAQEKAENDAPNEEEMEDDEEEGSDVGEGELDLEGSEEENETSEEEEGEGEAENAEI